MYEPYPVPEQVREQKLSRYSSLWTFAKQDLRLLLFFLIIAGLVGSSVGQSLFGAWGPSLAGMALIPSILGAVIVVSVVSFFLGKND